MPSTMVPARPYQSPARHFHNNDVVWFEVSHPGRTALCAPPSLRGDKAFIGRVGSCEFGLTRCKSSGEAERRPRPEGGAPCRASP